MEPIFYMEYMESKKIIIETFDAYYRFKNRTTWGPFKISNVKEKALEKGTERYGDIKRNYRKDRKVCVEFLEDSFCCTTGEVRQEYEYAEIEGIYETETTIAFVAGKNRKKDAFLALKKGSVKGKSLAELKKFALAKCTKVKDGVIAI